MAVKYKCGRGAVTLAQKGLLLVLLLLCFGCDLRPDRIGVSNTLIDFGLNETPFPLYVWSSFSRIPLMRITAETDADWIHLSPTTVDSLWVRDAGYDKRSIIVRIKRTLLDEGDHVGHIRITALAMRPKIVEVRVRMDADGRLTGLTIKDPVTVYSKPYLIDFVFSLRNASDSAVVAEPAQFDIAAFEDGEPVRAGETGLSLRRAPPRRLLTDIVLDYSLSMQETPGAIQSMEDAVRNDLLRFMTPETAVGITLFSRDDQPPVALSDFTTDHAHIREQLALIQQQPIGRFASGASLFDALLVSLNKFTGASALGESRHIFVVTDGYDTSSDATLDDVTRRARNRFTSIHVIGVGDEPNLATLLAMTGQTGGHYFSFRDDRDAIAPLVQELIGNLGGQYRLRWATLLRRDQDIYPAFTIALASNRAAYTAPRAYNPMGYADDTLRGIINTTFHDDGLRSSMVVGMDYVPRFIYDLRFYVDATYPFQVHVWETAEGGLLGLWELEQTVEDENRVWLHFYSVADPLPFAGFGPLFALDFGEVVSVPRPAVTHFTIDNTLYEDTVHFVITTDE